MHTLMFQLKRAHLRALAGARALSHKTGLTPARHDLLRCIESFGSAYAGGRSEEYQSRLWRALGISRTSASKMVRRLIALGLAERRRAPLDRRTFLVSLTTEGARRMRRAFLIVFKRKPLQRRFERAFGERSWTTHHAVINLAFAVERVARHFRDTSWPVYPKLEALDGSDSDRPNANANASDLDDDDHRYDGSYICAHDHDEADEAAADDDDFTPQAAR